jgi:hypothetical protein
MELSTLDRQFPSPFHTNQNSDALAGLAAKKMEEINCVQENCPPWRPYRPVELIIDCLAKPEA